MVALSTKNYHNLPEVKKRVEEKKRQEEKLENLKKRQEKVKDLDAVRKIHKYLLIFDKRLRRPKSAKRVATMEGNNSYMG